MKSYLYNHIRVFKDLKNGLTVEKVTTREHEVDYMIDPTQFRKIYGLEHGYFSDCLRLVTRLRPMYEPYILFSDLQRLALKGAFNDNREVKNFVQQIAILERELESKEGFKVGFCGLDDTEDTDPLKDVAREEIEKENTDNA